LRAADEVLCVRWRHRSRLFLLSVAQGLLRRGLVIFEVMHLVTFRINTWQSFLHIDFLSWSELLISIVLTTFFNMRALIKCLRFRVLLSMTYTLEEMFYFQKKSNEHKKALNI